MAAAVGFQPDLLILDRGSVLQPDPALAIIDEAQLCDQILGQAGLVESGAPGFRAGVWLAT